MSIKGPILATSRKLLRGVQLNLQDAALDTIGTSMTGSDIHFKSVPVQSIFSSASLFCSYIRHYVIRKEEPPSNLVNKIMNLLHPKSYIWNASENSELKQAQLTEMIAATRLRLQNLEAKKLYSPSFELSQELNQEGVRLSNLRKLLSFMNRPEFPIYSNLFPSSIPNSTTSLSMPAYMTGLAARSIHINGHKRILGVSIRIAGPRRGNRRVVWRRTIGATSTSAPNSTVYESAQIQLPSKVGVFGLKVKIAYCKRARLLNEANPHFRLVAPNVAPAPAASSLDNEQRLLEIFAASK